MKKTAASLAFVFFWLAVAGFGNDFLKKGENEFRKNNLPAAVENFTKSIEEKPSARAYFFRGAAYSALKRFEESANDYTKVLELDPNYKNVYWSRGYAYANLAKFPEAARDYTISLERDPEYKKMIYEMRAKVYFHLGELEKAEADLGDLLKLEPGNPIALEGMRMIQAKKNKAPQREWTAEEAKNEAFKNFHEKADVSKIPDSDPNFKENKQALAESKGGAYVQGRFVTAERDGHYVVSMFNENRIPGITFFYTKDGKTESFRLFSSPDFPRAAYIYCYSSCEYQGTKASAGDILSISFHPSEKEMFYFSRDGKLLYHQPEKGK